MRAAEIFAKLSMHMVEGMMLHNQLADGFAFLALPGFAEKHEHRFAEESENMRKVHAYYISRYNMLMDEGHAEDPHAIPRSWMGYSRQQVTQETKKKAVRELLEHWVKWERKTKDCYQHAYVDLTECGEIAAAQMIKRLLCDVDDELAYAENMHLRLEAVAYEMAAIEQMQEEVEENEMF